MPGTDFLTPSVVVQPGCIAYAATPGAAAAHNAEKRSTRATCQRKRGGAGAGGGTRSFRFCTSGYVEYGEQYGPSDEEGRVGWVGLGCCCCYLACAGDMGMGLLWPCDAHASWVSSQPAPLLRTRGPIPKPPPTPTHLPPLVARVCKCTVVLLLVAHVLVLEVSHLRCYQA